MSYRVWLLAVALFLGFGGPARADDPHRLIAASMAAMGGQEALAGIHAIEYTAVGERQMVEQSERPSGPYFIDHFHEQVTVDYAGDRERVDATHEAYAADHWWTEEEPQARTLVINGTVAAVDAGGGKFQYAGAAGVADLRDAMLFDPTRVLLTAERASDLRALPDVKLHGVMHHVLTFTADGIPCKLSINADTNLPWEIDFTHAYPNQVFLNAWGDVATSVTFSAWSLEPYGVRYPREWTYRRLGLPDRQVFIVGLHVNPTLDESKVAIPKDTLAAFPAPRAIDDYALGYGGDGTPHDLASGVTEIPGGWNVAWIKQADGIVMIEAPWSTGYTKKALDAARRRYGMPVKAVITTSDSWPHIAGVREAVAQGVTVYALDLNKPILERLLAAPHKMRPDDLQRHPRAPHFVFVTDPLSIGSGENRLTIYPYRTQTGERQMMVYFPHHQLLYTSDLFSTDSSPADWFTPQYLSEAIGAITRYHLTPVTIFGMHYDATPYATIVKVLSGWTAPS